MHRMVSARQSKGNYRRPPVYRRLGAGSRRMQANWTRENRAPFGGAVDRDRARRWCFVECSGQKTHTAELKECAHSRGAEWRGEEQNGEERSRMERRGAEGRGEDEEFRSFWGNTRARDTRTHKARERRGRQQQKQQKLEGVQHHQSVCFFVVSRQRIPNYFRL